MKYAPGAERTNVSDVGPRTARIWAGRGRIGDYLMYFSIALNTGVPDFPISS
jgi:hypothetical protein